MPSDQRNFDVSKLSMLTGADMVRHRPRLYYGVDRDDPRLPELVLRDVVHGVMFVPPVGDTLEVVVTIEDDLVFAVRDNGPGMSPTPRHHSMRPAPEEMLTSIHGAHFDRGGAIGVAGAVCRQVELRTSWQGVEYATGMADWIVVPIEQVGPSSFTGTEIRMWLDADFMTLGSRLPSPTPELAESLLAGRRRLTDRLTILDRRPTKPAEGTSRNAEG